MCITTKLSYRCGHPATGPFRSEKCPSLGSALCVTTEYSREVPVDCTKCNWRNDPDAVKHLELYLQGLDIFWDMPYRCFTDPGFQRIDPFAADRVKQQLEATKQPKAAVYRSRSFSGFRQRWHSLRTSGGPQKTSGPDSCIGSVLFNVPLAPCCQDHRFLNMWYGRMRKDRQDDDQCLSQF